MVLFYLQQYGYYQLGKNEEYVGLVYQWIGLVGLGCDVGLVKEEVVMLLGGGIVLFMFGVGNVCR